MEKKQTTLEDLRNENLILHLSDKEFKEYTDYCCRRHTSKEKNLLENVQTQINLTEYHSAEEKKYPFADNIVREKCIKLEVSSDIFDKYKRACKKMDMTTEEDLLLHVKKCLDMARKADALKQQLGI